MSGSTSKSSVAVRAAVALDVVVDVAVHEVAVAAGVDVVVLVVALEIQSARRRSGSLSETDRVVVPSGLEPPGRVMLPFP